LPEGLEGAFTADDYQKALGCPRWIAGRALNVLAHLGLLRECGRRGRAKLYETIEKSYKI
jgi:Fic family protein